MRTYGLVFIGSIVVTVSGVRVIFLLEGVAFRGPSCCPFVAMVVQGTEENQWTKTNSFSSSIAYILEVRDLS